MNKRNITGGGKSFADWWKNPKNRQKVYDSDRADAEELKRMESTAKETPDLKQQNNE